MARSGRDIREFCMTCPEYQKVGRPLLSRVPIIETPVIISVSYNCMAFDIVEPLTKW